MFNLNQKKIDINTLKEKVLRYLLNEQEKLGFIKSETEYESEYNRLSAQINTGKTVMELREQSDRTDVEAFNKTLQEVYLDLLTAFEQMNAVAATVEEHKKLNNAIVSNIKTKLSQLQDEVAKLEDSYQSQSGNLVYVENFRSTDSFETNPELYTDEKGIRVSDAYTVGYDKYNECIKLPKLVSINKLIAVNGQKMAAIKINKQLGDGLISIKNPNNNIEKAIDTSLESYWEEVILADEPIKVELDATKYYKIGFGAMCEVEIAFNNMVEINEISLMAFGQFPLEVVAIKYYHSDQPDDEEERDGIKEIVGPHQLEPRMQSQMIKDSVSYQFPSVAVKRLRVILNQQHYIKNSFIYDKREHEKNNIWFNKDADIKFSFDGVFKGMYNDKLLTDRPWMLFSKSVQESGDIDLEDMLFSKRTTLTPVTKYEYNYGLYNISINENAYKDFGIYISKPIKLNSNIGSVQLLVDETIPFPESRNYSVKYYVSTKSRPTKQNDWIPITPINSDSRKERLSFQVDPTDSTKVFALTEFPMDSIISFTRDHVLPVLSYVVAGPNRIEMLANAISLNSVYHITYGLSEHTRIVDFRRMLADNLIDIGINKEKFFGTKNAMLELQSTPYVDFNNLKSPVRITIIDNKGKLISEPEIENVTDYYNPISSYSNFDRHSNKIQYYFHKNVIYFNTSLPKDYIIEVDYRHFINFIRMKAILERTDNSNNGLSPILNGYKLLFKTIQ